MFLNINKKNSHDNAVLLRGGAFVAPMLGIGVLLAPLGILGGIYAKYYGLAFTTVATVMLVAQLFDAFSDPVVGWYSDQIRERTGSRKQFILAGGLLLAISSYCLFVPPGEVTALYFGGWFLAYYFGWTVFHIPHLAWAHEVSATTSEKTLIFSFLAVAQQGGMLLFYLVPLLPLFASSEITPETLRVSAIFGGVLLLPGLYMALKYVPNGRSSVSKLALSTEADQRTLKTKFLEMCIALWANKPFLIFVLAYMCLGLAVGIWSALFFIYVDIYLGMGNIFAEISLFGVIGALFVTPFWYYLSLRWGKRNTWLLAIGILIAVFFYTARLTPENSHYFTLVALFFLLTSATVCVLVMSNSVLSDIVDYGALKDRSERSAIYFSISNLQLKIQGAIGTSMGLAIIGWFGFEASASGQSADGLLGLRMAISSIPMILALIAGFFVFLLPLNERRQKIIRQRLDARSERALRSKKPTKPEKGVEFQSNSSDGLVQE